MAKGKRGRTKGSKPKTKKVAVKNDEIYEAIIYADKPNCPACDNRDYSITDYGMKDDTLIKFYVKCNVCRANFIYCKPIAAI